MKKILLFTILFTSIAINGIKVFSQTAKADFFERSNSIKSEYGNEYRTVLFTLMNVNGNEDKLITSCLQDELIKEIEIKPDGSCIAVLHNSISPDYLLPILKSYNASFDISTIKVFDNSFVHPNMPTDFPVYRETGNPKLDKNVYIQNIDSWRKLNPVLWEQYFVF